MCDDLISREETLYELATSAVYYFGIEEDKAAHDWAMGVVSKMPSAQPEIIRCKDCKWWDKIEDSPFGYCMAMKHGKDTIYRQDAIDALEKGKPLLFIDEDGSIDPFGAGQQNQWYRDGIVIMNLPSAQPEPKRMRGKWQEHKDYPNLAYLCSECGHFTTMRTNFCPSCGVDMRGEQE